MFVMETMVRGKRIEGLKKKVEEGGVFYSGSSGEKWGFSFVLEEGRGG